MKRLNHKFRKGLVLFLSLVMVTGLVPAMPGGANTEGELGSQLVNNL